MRARPSNAAAKTCMTIEATSTDPQNITEFLNEVRGLARENQWVLVNERRV